MLNEQITNLNTTEFIENHIYKFLKTRHIYQDLKQHDIDSYREILKYFKSNNIKLTKSVKEIFRVKDNKSASLIFELLFSDDLDNSSQIRLYHSVRKLIPVVDMNLGVYIFNKIDKILKLTNANILEYTKQLELLKKNIIPFKGNDTDSLTEFYINVMHRIKDKPSLNDLEKGSNIDRSKWNRHINKNQKFIYALFGDLQQLHSKNPKIEYISKTYDFISQKLLKLQEYLKKEKSHAISYDDYTE